MPCSMNRYHHPRPLAQGGSAIVEVVDDVLLRREVARKMLKPTASRMQRARFIAEAKIVASLQHPNIVPIYDADLEADPPWYVMPQIKGRSLAIEIEQAHLLTGREKVTAIRRLVRAMQSVGLAVEHAHERGILHRDLKPLNILLGERDEVHLVDWGLAKQVGTELPEITAPQTIEGMVSGTPAYMSPEQAAGRGDVRDARTDVYGLGATLFSVIFGVLPYVGDVASVLTQVLDGLPRELLDVPDTSPTLTLGMNQGHQYRPASVLMDLCRESMAGDIEDRTASAAAFADALVGYLEGDQNVRDALALVEEADVIEPQISRFRARAAKIDLRAEDVLRQLPQGALERERAPAWLAMKEADSLRLKASKLEQEVEQLLQGALRLSDQLPAAHLRLARKAQQRLAAAERDRDMAASLLQNRLLRFHTGELPKGRQRKRLERWVKGDGALTLHSDPPGSEVRLHRYVERNRRLVPVFERSLGQTPLENVRIPAGSYLCTLHRTGHEIVRYPVFIERLDHWKGRPPGSSESLPVHLPKKGVIPEDCVFVPGTWAWLRGHENHPTVRKWTDSLVFQRFPVTWKSYLRFLNDIAKNQGRKAAIALAPALFKGDHDPVLLVTLGKRGFRPKDKNIGLDEPVVNILRSHGAAYLAWLAEKTGLPWRLPSTGEWEVAARGVDGRRYIWGPYSESCWANFQDSHRSTLEITSIRDRPEDESPYGVRGCAGNVSDWVADDLDGPNPIPWRDGGRVPEPAQHGDRTVFHLARGGNMQFRHDEFMVADEMGVDADTSSKSIGIRGCYTFQK